MKNTVVTVLLILTVIMSSALIPITQGNVVTTQSEVVLGGQSTATCKLYNQSFVESYDTLYVKRIYGEDAYTVIDANLKNDVLTLLLRKSDETVLASFNVTDLTKKGFIWTDAFEPNTYETILSYDDENDMYYITHKYKDRVKVFLFYKNLSLDRVINIIFNNTYYWQEFEPILLGDKTIFYHIYKGDILLLDKQFQFIGAKKIEVPNYREQVIKIQVLRNSILLMHLEIGWNRGVVALDTNLQPLWGYMISGYEDSFYVMRYNHLTTDNAYLIVDNKIVKIYPNGTIAWAKSVRLTPKFDEPIFGTYLMYATEYYGVTIVTAYVRHRGTGTALLFFDDNGNFIGGKYTHYYPVRFYYTPIFPPFIYKGSVILTPFYAPYPTIIKEGLGTPDFYMQDIRRYFNITVDNINEPIIPLNVTIKDNDIVFTVIEEPASQYNVVSLSPDELDVKTVSEVFIPKCVSPVDYRPVLITGNLSSVNKTYAWIFHGTSLKSIYLIDRNNLILSSPYIIGYKFFNIYYDIYFMNMERESIEYIKIGLPSQDCYCENFDILYNNDSIFLLSSNCKKIYIIKTSIDGDFIKIVEIETPVSFVFITDIYSMEDKIILYSREFIVIVDTELSSLKLLTINYDITWFVDYLGIKNNNYLSVYRTIYYFSRIEQYINIDYYSENLTRLWGYSLYSYNKMKVATAYLGKYIYVLIDDYIDNKHKALILKFNYDGILVDQYVVEFTNDFYPHGVVEYGDYLVLYGVMRDIAKDYYGNEYNIYLPAIVVLNDNEIVMAKILNPIFGIDVIRDYLNEKVSFILINETGEYIMSNRARVFYFGEIPVSLLIKDSLHNNPTSLMGDARNLVALKPSNYEFTQPQHSLIDVTTDASMQDLWLDINISRGVFINYYKAFDTIAGSVIFGSVEDGYVEEPQINPTASPSFPMFEINVLNTLSTNQMLLVLLFLLFFIPITRAFGVSRALSIASTVCAVVSLMVGAYNVFSMFLVLSILGFALWQSGY